MLAEPEASQVRDTLIAASGAPIEVVSAPGRLDDALARVKPRVLVIDHTYLKAFRKATARSENGEPVLAVVWRRTPGPMGRRDDTDRQLWLSGYSTEDLCRTLLDLAPAT